MKAIIKKLIEEPTRKNLEQLKLAHAKAHRAGPPSSADIYAKCSPREKELLGRILQLKPVRSISGIAVIAAMTPPYECPGRCIYCPQGEGSPKSYTGYEPASRRAKSVGYDPYKQVRLRLSQLKQTGHETQKAELIIMGGTFPAQPEKIQRQFLKNCIDALNNKKSKNLADAIKRNEHAKTRCVGITFESRPDYCMEKEIDSMLAMGCTRVELGVQSLYPQVLEYVQRGHKAEDTTKSTRLLKNAGLKVNYHIMPGLPLTTKKMDVEMFRTLFSGERFQPDMLKIYPCLVIKGTKLHELWTKKEFTPLTAEEAVERIAEGIRYVPKYVRIMRMMRDIPADHIEAGAKKSHITDLVNQRLKEQGLKCRCIRCREAGHAYLKSMKTAKKPELTETSYGASGGKEIFLAYEDLEQDLLLGYLRLRFPQESHRKEINPNTALVRELRVFGSPVPIGMKSADSYQHRGMGKSLLERAEELSKENGKEKILITSAIGTRDYYRKFGYRLTGPYMRKKI